MNEKHLLHENVEKKKKRWQNYFHKFSILSIRD